MPLTKFQKVLTNKSDALKVFVLFAELNRGPAEKLCLPNDCGQYGIRGDKAHQKLLLVLQVVAW